LSDLPLAALVQYANAAAAIAALHALERQPGNEALDLLAHADAGLRAARVPARLQILPGTPQVIVDVGHNPQAARALAAWLDETPGGAVHAVYGALSDKDVEGVLAALAPRIAHWHFAGLDRATPRGLPASALRDALRRAAPQATFDLHDEVPQALTSARRTAGAAGRVLAFGSFFVAAAVLVDCDANHA
jgi:dihydrofolate synthase/folylpolyglutamate synthase